MSLKNDFIKHINDGYTFKGESIITWWSYLGVRNHADAE
jgi:hypothetical protein